MIPVCLPLLLSHFFLLSQHHTYDLFSQLFVSGCRIVLPLFERCLFCQWLECLPSWRRRAKVVPAQCLGYGLKGLAGRRGDMWRDMGVLGDVAECPIPHAPCPAECGLADLWEPINASPNAGKEERLSCNPYWLPCALSAHLYHGFVPLNDVLLSSSPTLIHNIISFHYSPNYSSSDLNGNRMNETNSRKQTNKHL